MCLKMKPARLFSLLLLNAIFNTPSIANLLSSDASNIRDSSEGSVKTINMDKLDDTGMKHNPSDEERVLEGEDGNSAQQSKGVFRTGLELDKTTEKPDATDEREIQQSERAIKEVTNGDKAMYMDEPIVAQQDAIKEAGSEQSETKIETETPTSEAQAEQEILETVNAPKESDEMAATEIDNKSGTLHASAEQITSAERGVEGGVEVHKETEVEQSKKQTLGATDGDRTTDEPNAAQKVIEEGSEQSENSVEDRTEIVTVEAKAEQENLELVELVRKERDAASAMESDNVSVKDEAAVTESEQHESENMDGVVDAATRLGEKAEQYVIDSTDTVKGNRKDFSENNITEDQANAITIQEATDSLVSDTDLTSNQPEDKEELGDPKKTLSLPNENASKDQSESDKPAAKPDSAAEQEVALEAKSEQTESGLKDAAEVSITENTISQGAASQTSQYESENGTDTGFTPDKPVEEEAHEAAPADSVGKYDNELKGATEPISVEPFIISGLNSSHNDGVHAELDTKADVEIVEADDTEPSEREKMTEIVTNVDESDNIGGQRDIGVTDDALRVTETKDQSDIHFNTAPLIDVTMHEVNQHASLQQSEIEKSVAGETTTIQPDNAADQKAAEGEQSESVSMTETPTTIYKSDNAADHGGVQSESEIKDETDNDTSTGQPVDEALRDVLHQQTFDAENIETEIKTDIAVETVETAEAKVDSLDDRQLSTINLMDSEAIYEGSSESTADRANPPRSKDNESETSFTGMCWKLLLNASVYWERLGEDHSPLAQLVPYLIACPLLFLIGCTCIVNRSRKDVFSKGKSTPDYSVKSRRNDHTRQKNLKKKEKNGSKHD